MASDQSLHGADAAGGPPSGELVVKLRILSPSVGVNRPLTFPDLPSTTTVKDLKSKIRESLPMRPADDQQRLIHRGRAISKETDTLLQILGEANIRTGDQQTMHLVIRDISGQQSTPTPTTATSTLSNAQSSQEPASQRQTAPHPHVHRHHHSHHNHQHQGSLNTRLPQPHQVIGGHPQPPGSQSSQGFPRRNPTQPTIHPLRPPSVPSPSPIHNAEQAAAFQHHHQTMTNWLRNAAQQHGTYVNPVAPRNPTGEPSSGRGSPLSHFYRETIGPNGQAYQVETVIRGSSLVPNPPTAPLSIPEAQNILRQADMAQVTMDVNEQLQRGTSESQQYARPVEFSQPPNAQARMLVNAHMRRAASEAQQARSAVNVQSQRDEDDDGATYLSHADIERDRLAANGLLQQGNSRSSSASRRSPVRPAPSEPAHPQGAASRQGRQGALPTILTPDSLAHWGFNRTGMSSGVQNPANMGGWGGGYLQRTDQPLPQFNSRHGIEVYVLSSPEGPRALLVHNNSSETYYTPRLRSQASQPWLRAGNVPAGAGLEGLDGVRSEPGQQAPQPAQEPQGPAQDQLPDGLPGLPGDGVANPHGPQGPVLPPLLVQAWPHIWLLFRLGVFVWFFTTPQSSWSRWFSVVGLALFIFILSSGVLHGFANMVWRPFAQQLERLLPRLEPPPGQREAEGADGNQDPNPANMAARLVRQQRERQGWFSGQVRRIERAALLFLASIAPGVAEGHIANLEAEARAERQRQEAEAAEAVRRQEEAANSGAAEGNGAEGEQSAEQSTTAQQPPANDGARDGAPQPQLVAI